MALYFGGCSRFHLQIPMVNLRRLKKRAILHGAKVEDVEACEDKVGVENVLRKFLRKKVNNKDPKDEPSN